jgi:hypothetical protein
MVRIAKNRESAISASKSLTGCRFDLLGSSIFDSKPRFALPRDCPFLTTDQGLRSPALQSLLRRLSRASDEFAKLSVALEATARLAQYVNVNGHDLSLLKNGATAARQITPVMHLLLSLPRQVDYTAVHRASPEERLLELTRLALLITLSKLKQIFALISVELETLLDKFTALCHTAQFYEGPFPGLGLSACIIVASMHEGRPKNVLVNAICRAMRSTGIETAKDAIQRTKQFMWIDVLMDDGVEALEADVDNAFHSFGNLMTPTLHGKGCYLLRSTEPNPLHAWSPHRR